jgi:drug/metabolite transporter (DMT)-like permease
MPTTSSASDPAARRSAFVLLGMSIAVGSVSFTLVQVALRELSPLALSCGRVVVSAVAFALVVLRRPGLRTPIRKEDRWKVLFCGFGGSALFHLLFNWGQHQVSIAVAAVIMAMYPVLTALGEVVFLRHRLRRLQVAGLMLSTLGCIAIGATSGGSDGSAPLWGALAVLAAAIVWAAVTVVTRGFHGRYDAWWLNTPGTIVGAVFILVVASPRLYEFGSLSVKGWLVVIWLGAASSAFIYYSLAKVMTVVSATTATSISTVVTPLSVLVAWVWLGQPPTWFEAIGGAVVVAGVVLVTRQATEETEESETVTVPDVRSSI